MTRLSGITFFVVVLLAGCAFGGCFRLWQLASMQHEEQQHGSARSDDTLDRLITDAKRSVTFFAVLALLGTNFGLLCRVRSLQIELAAVRLIEQEAIE